MIQSVPQGEAKGRLSASCTTEAEMSSLPIRDSLETCACHVDLSSREFVVPSDSKQRTHQDDPLTVYSQHPSFYPSYFSCSLAESESDMLRRHELSFLA